MCEYFFLLLFMATWQTPHADEGHDVTESTKEIK